MVRGIAARDDQKLPLQRLRNVLEVRTTVRIRDHGDGQPPRARQRREGDGDIAGDRPNGDHLDNRCAEE